jgi:hypothetical protein
VLLRREWQDWEVRQVRGSQDTFLQRQRERARPPPVVDRILGTQRKAELIDAAVDILRDGRRSPFEFEAPVRHGIRVALCLEAWPWRDADMAASQTLAAAFRLLGVQRPKWQEGQPEARDWDPRYGHRRCAGCGDLIDPDGAFDTCSPYCSHLVSQRKYRREHQAKEAAAAKIRRVINPERYKARAKENWLKAREMGWLQGCETCGKQFHVRTGTDRAAARYCSLECYWKRGRTDNPDRQCAECGVSFTVSKKSDDRRFCSPACWYRHLSKLS